MKNTKDRSERIDLNHALTGTTTFIDPEFRISVLPPKFEIIAKNRSRTKIMEFSISDNRGRTIAKKRCKPGKKVIFLVRSYEFLYWTLKEREIK